MIFPFRNIAKLASLTLLICCLGVPPAGAATSVTPPAPAKPVPVQPQSAQSGAPSTAPAASTNVAKVPAPPKAPALSAKAALLMDASNGRVLYSLNPHTRRSPASLTKMLTALVAIDQPNLSATTTISSLAAGRPASKLGLHKGDRISLSVLLQALLMGSCNDAATAIAEQISGSEKSFATKMNALAKKLGATESNFVNPHGLDASGHYSTAYDLAVLARHFLQKPELAKIVTQSNAYLSWQGGSKDMANINSFLWRYEGATGIKTGYTQQAGYALAASASRNSRHLIVILLGCTSSEKRWADAQVLMDYGMDNFTALEAAAKQKAASYTVRAGDTLTAIAARLGTTVNALLEANPKLKSNPNHLLVGEKLNVP